MKPWTGVADALSDRVAAFVDASLAGAPTEPFAALALAIHAFQAEHDPVQRALVEAPVTRWEDIPAVPVALYKDFPVGTVTPGEEAAAFRTSGTTGGGRGVHRMRSTALYDRGALGWARACVPAMPTDVVALLDAAPDSSLGHMAALFGPTTWHCPGGALDRAGLDARIRAATGPVFVASTAFALAEWLDAPVPRLPGGSVLMVTGGFKGRVHRLDGAELTAEAAAALAPARLVLEYGMTELSSQLWADYGGQPYRPPPWLRARAVDPATGDGVAADTRGQLRFYDLCNLDAALAVETMDEGVVHADGSVTLLGRLADAPVRGCSLTVEEAWLLRGRR